MEIDQQPASGAEKVAPRASKKRTGYQLILDCFRIILIGSALGAPFAFLIISNRPDTSSEMVHKLAWICGAIFIGGFCGLRVCGIIESVLDRRMSSKNRPNG
jgi:hypothetical protein